jgi:3-dehydroquinate synthase
MIADLVQRNVIIKTKVVKEDEFETGERRLLNFGHTLGHALENQYELSHGQAISIGMTYAAFISEKMTGFAEAERVSALLGQYELPGLAKFDSEKVFHVMKMDKKREKKEMNYVLLEKIGKAIIKSIPVHRLQTAIKQLNK